jgi:hypothetical protein
MFAPAYMGRKGRGGAPPMLSLEHGAFSLRRRLPGGRKEECQPAAIREDSFVPQELYEQVFSLWVQACRF